MCSESIEKQVHSEKLPGDARLVSWATSFIGVQQQKQKAINAAQMSLICPSLNCKVCTHVGMLASTQLQRVYIISIRP